MEIVLNNLNFFINKNFLFFKTKNRFIFSVIRLPFFYISKLIKKNLTLILFSKFFFKTFLRNFFIGNSRLSAIYSFKMKLKGLGFRFRRFSSRLFRFFFNMVNYFYIHIPQAVILKKYRRFILLISRDMQVLSLLIVHLLLLYELIPYKMRGLSFPRKII
jgi:hypothetical protein